MGKMMSFKNSLIYIGRVLIIAQIGLLAACGDSEEKLRAAYVEAALKAAEAKNDASSYTQALDLYEDAASKARYILENKSSVTAQELASGNLQLAGMGVYDFLKKEAAVQALSKAENSLSHAALLFASHSSDEFFKSFWSTYREAKVNNSYSEEVESRLIQIVEQEGSGYLFGVLIVERLKKGHRDEALKLIDRGLEMSEDQSRFIYSLIAQLDRLLLDDLTVRRLLSLVTSLGGLDEFTALRTLHHNDSRGDKDLRFEDALKGSATKIISMENSEPKFLESEWKFKYLLEAYEVLGLLDEVEKSEHRIFESNYDPSGKIDLLMTAASILHEGDRRESARAIAESGKSIFRKEEFKYDYEKVVALRSVVVGSILMGDNAEAVKYEEFIQKLDEVDIYYYKLVLDAQLKEGNVDDAKRVIDKILSLIPDLDTEEYSIARNIWAIQSAFSSSAKLGDIERATSILTAWVAYIAKLPSVDEIAKILPAPTYLSTETNVQLDEDGRRALTGLVQTKFPIGEFWL